MSGQEDLPQNLAQDPREEQRTSTWDVVAAVLDAIVYGGELVFWVLTAILRGIAALIALVFSST